MRSKCVPERPPKRSFLTETAPASICIISGLYFRLFARKGLFFPENEGRRSVPRGIPRHRQRLGKECFFCNEGRQTVWQRWSICRTCMLPETCSVLRILIVCPTHRTFVQHLGAGHIASVPQAPGSGAPAHGSCRRGLGSGLGLRGCR